MRNPRTAIPLGAAKRKPTLKHTPFPGLIDDNLWNVREGRWPTFIDRNDLDGTGGTMQVPLDSSDVGRKLRLHEQAHVKFTPSVTDEDVRAFGVDPRTLGACEDGRIIHLMNKRSKWRKVNRDANTIPDALAQKYAVAFGQLAEKLAGPEPREEEDPSYNQTFPDQTMPLIEVGRLLASTRGYAEGKFFDRLSAQHDLNWARNAVENMHGRYIAHKHPPTFDDTVAYARELERFFTEMKKLLAEQGELLLEADMPNVLFPIESEDGLVWGEMSTQQAPLTERLRGDPSRRNRATDTGAVPRYLHRLNIDQRVFVRKRKHKVFQGTVLIDHSGSMSLSVQEVDQMLKHWPAITIASYAGDRGHGVLRIIAKNGKRAANEWLACPSEGGNVVDGPALDWLCKQKGPRVWISDGRVSGAYENFHPWFSLDAARKVRRGRIKHIQNVRELLGT